MRVSRVSIRAKAIVPEPGWRRRGCVPIFYARRAPGVKAGAFRAGGRRNVELASTGGDL
jgi:hypothetical protein